MLIDVCRGSSCTFPLAYTVLFVYTYPLQMLHLSCSAPATSVRGPVLFNPLSDNTLRLPVRTFALLAYTTLLSYTVLLAFATPAPCRGQLTRFLLAYTVLFAYTVLLAFVTPASVPGPVFPLTRCPSIIYPRIHGSNHISLKELLTFSL